MTSRTMPKNMNITPAGLVNICSKSFIKTSSGDVARFAVLLFEQKEHK